MLRSDWVIVTAGQKLLIGVALCLPVPALALSGLALPLPTAVYRVAVAIVESTEGLTRAFTGEDQETHVLAVRKATVSPRPHSPRVVSNPRAASPSRASRASTGVARSARTRARSFGAAVTRRSPRTKSSGDVARTTSSPAAETGAETTVRTAAAPESTQSPVSATERRAEPIPPLGEVAHVQTPIPKPAASPPPPPPALSPPPAPTQPGLFEPVTKPLEPATDPVTHTIQPATDALQPVTKPLDPVLEKTGLGGLLGSP
jgi:hypothetical protein